MPLPALPIIGIGLGALAVVFGASFAAFLIRNRGKCMVVVGPRASGKTTLYDYLVDGTVVLPDGGEREQTPGTVKRGPFSIFSIKVRRPIDVGGGAGNYPHWKEPFKAADLVCYVFNAHEALESRAYRQEMSQDRQYLESLVASDERQRKFYVVGTHADLSPMRLVDFGDRVKDLDEVIDIQTHLNAACEIGSLVNDDEAAALVKRAFK